MKTILVYVILIFLSGCSNVFYQPAAKHFFDPAQFKLSYQDVYFQSSDKTLLHGWFFPAKGRPKGTIIQFHGNGENISTHFLSLVWMVEEGYNLFTFDYRGYAKSEGESNQAGIYLDALAALSKAREFHLESGGGKFIVYGQSTGGAISLRALPDYEYYSEVTLTVMDSAFSSYQDIAFDKLKSVWLFWPFSPLAYLLISDKYAADKVFKKITRPTLVIIGMQDRFVSPKFGKRIFKKIAASEKFLWKIEEGGHINIFHHHLTNYRQEFLALLDGFPR